MSVGHLYVPTWNSPIKSTVKEYLVNLSLNIMLRMKRLVLGPYSPLAVTVRLWVSSWAVSRSPWRHVLSLQCPDCLTGSWSIFPSEVGIFSFLTAYRSLAFSATYRILGRESMLSLYLNFHYHRGHWLRGCFRYQLCVCACRGSCEGERKLLNC